MPNRRHHQANLGSCINESLMGLKARDRIAVKARLRLIDVIGGFHLFDDDQDAWVGAASMQLPRSDHQSVFVGGTIYVLGGRICTTGIPTDSPETTADCQSLVPGNLAWVPIAPMIRRRSNPVAAAGSDGKIYVFGGFDNTNPLDSVEVYDPQSLSWSSCAPMPIPLGWGAAVAMPDQTIVVTGGYNKDGYFIRDNTLRYNSLEDKWTQLSPMPKARYAHGAALGTNNKVYVIGGRGLGFNEDGEQITITLGDVHSYDPVADAWTECEPLPHPRSELSAVTTSSGLIYAIGGMFCCCGIGAVDGYDPIEDKWSAQPPLLQPRWSHAAVISDDNIIYVTGGQCKSLTSAGFLLNTTEKLNPGGNSHS